MTELIQKIAPIEQVDKATISRWQIFFLAASGVAIALCEWVFAYQNVAYGIIIALGLAIMMYVMVSVLKFDERITKCVESLALIPLYILFTSSLPWFFINQQYLLPAVYATILALCFWHIHRSNLSIKQIIGFSKEKFLKYALMGVVIGAPLGIIEYFILQPAASFPTFELRYFLRDVVYMLFFVGLAEEILFRGLIQTDFSQAFGWKWGLLAASLLFAVMHLTWRSLPELGFVFLAGLILGIMYLKTKSLVAPIIAHAVNNVMLVALAPYIFHLK